MSTPDHILTDDRLSRMRSNVMSRVDADAARLRRKRRATQVVLACAAALVVVVVGGGFVLSMLPKGSPQFSSSPDRAFRTAAPAAPLGPATGAATPAAPTPTGVPTTEHPEAARQVVITGSIRLTSDDPARVAAALADTVEKQGGRVDERRESDTDNRTATVLLRVPNQQVTTLVSEAKGMGKVESVSLQEEDVTATAVDLDARIRATQLSVDRLSDILARADTSAKVIEAENALTTRQQELERLQSQRTALSARVSLSSVTVTISTESAPAHGGFLGGLTAGWHAMAGAGRGLVIIVGALLPWLALLLVLYAAYRVIRRVRQ